MKTIQTHKISKKYGNFAALKDVNLTVNKGDIYGLVGRNGAGKTTLFKVLLGLSKASSGTLSLNGKSSDAELNLERRSVGFLIGQNFFPYMSGYQNIEYYRRLKGIKDKNETSRVLKIVGLEGVKKPFKSYSMGMKQRLGIANAILGNPEIVILDEPINGLDPQGIVEIRQLIKNLNENYGMTLIISSHILSELDLVASRFGIIDNGNLLEEFNATDTDLELEHTLILETDNNYESLKIINKCFEIIATLESNHLVIKNTRIEPKEFVKTLVEAGIGINYCERIKKTLETRYFDVTEVSK